MNPALYLCNSHVRSFYPFHISHRTLHTIHAVGINFGYTYNMTSNRHGELETDGVGGSTSRRNWFDSSPLLYVSVLTVLLTPTFYWSIHAPSPTFQLLHDHFPSRSRSSSSHSLYLPPHRSAPFPSRLARPSPVHDHC